MTIYNITTVNAKGAHTKSFLTEEEARKYFNTRVSNISRCENVAKFEKVSENLFKFEVMYYPKDEAVNFMSLTASEL
jgi:hypothetical protein